MTAAHKMLSPDFAASRNNMIESQIRPNKVRDERVLTVMGAMPREAFVPAPMAGIAYIDEDLQVSTGRYLLEPMILARLLEEACVISDDRVLDIGCATGYSTAVLAMLARNVVAIESDPLLQNKAAANLSSLQITNAEVHCANMAEGYKDKAPYDVILINGSIEIEPDMLTAQLAEGGRLLAVVREYGPAKAAHTGEARLYEKVRGVISHRSLFDANLKPLPGFQAAKKFSF